MPWDNWIGKERYWTRERVVEVLKMAAADIDGPLPCGDLLYLAMKELGWPPLTRIYEYFGSIARGWLNAGVDERRVALFNVPWIKTEESYLLEHAGKKSLEEIALYLRRSYGAVRRRLYKLKVKARDNQGLYSAAELAKEYNCPYHRVRDAIGSGRIPGEYDSIRHRWQVDIKKLTPAAEAILQKPKMTHKTSPPDVGDYMKRHGLYRKFIDGHTVVVGR
jgi:hypothetical protein